MLIPDHNIFQDDAVKVLRAVDVLRRPLRCRDEHFPVLVQPLFVDGNLHGISSEPVEGIDENDLPFLRTVAVGKHLLELCSVVVCAGHGAVDIRFDDTQTVAFRKFVTDTELPFDGLFRLPDGTTPIGNVPYLEASVGIENIFKILRIDYYRRLTYLDQPNIKKGGVRIALRFTF